MCRASVGMTIRLEGVRSHAATPEKGRSPIDALLRLASHVTSIGATTDAMVTIVSIRSGERDFGIAPGDAELCITIRGGVETPLDKLCTALEADARRIARAGGVSSSVVLSDAFPAVDNDRDAVRAIYAAAGALEREVIAPTLPFAFSEDVAHLIAAYGGAFCGIGAGEGHAALHDPTYDFPDALIEIGAPVLFEIARRMSDA